MTAKMTNKLSLCVSAIARKFGYVSQKKAALGFAEGWYMHNERAAACWQSVEEAFANSELQDLLPTEINFKVGELTKIYFDSLSPIEKESFIKCREQKEGFVLVPVVPTEQMLLAGGYTYASTKDLSIYSCRARRIYMEMIAAVQEASQ